MKKEIEQEVEEALSNGQTHQQVFDALNPKYYKNGKLLTDVLCKTPIPVRKQRFKAVWIILIGILGILLALRSLSVVFMEGGFNKFVNVFFGVILAYVIYSVAKYEKYTFQFLGVLGIVNILWIIRSSRAFGTDTNPDTFISLILVFGMCVCSYIIYFQVFVKHEIAKKLVIDPDGRRRMEVHAFFIERKGI